MAAGDLTVGQFFNLLPISTRMTMPMFILGMLLNQLQKGEAAARRVFALVDLEPSIVDAPDAQDPAETIASVSFDGVTFA